MTLTNEQYDSIMREYSRRQAAGRQILARRRQKAYALLPRLAEIDAEISSLSASRIRELLSGSAGPDNDDLRRSLSALEKEQRALLKSSGLGEDYLEPPYECPLCQDTGFVDGRKCACFRKAETDLLYRQSNLADQLEKENFQTFSFQYYSATIRDETTGSSALELARKAYNISRSFVEDFGKDFRNLFFYGDTGVGKTFLSHCIAQALLSRAYSVLYFSSFQLFQQLAGEAFQGKEPYSEEKILGCDLLIIDDLGTELTNAFVSSRLFYVVSERLGRRRPTVISTNLTLQDFSDTYSERTFSRIASAYTMCKLTGKDIRIQKKLNGGQ